MCSSRIVRVTAIAALCSLMILVSAHADSYTIFGDVTDAAGQPVAGAMIDFGGALPAQVTDAQGRYAAEGAETGESYTVTPSLTGYVFFPTSATVLVSSGDERVDFRAEQVAGAAGSLMSTGDATVNDDRAKIAPDIYESDDTPSAAKSILNGASQQRSIHAVNNTDWAHFDLNVRANVRIETSGAGDYDTELQLYGPDTTTTFVETDHDSGTGRYSLIVREGLNSLGPGRYWISVRKDNINDTIPAYALALTITYPGEQVLYPAGPSIVWKVGESYNIRWENFIGNHVKIELKQTPSISICTISESTPNDGSFWWRVPGDLPATGAGFRVRVTSCLFPDQEDYSYFEFEIQNAPRVTIPSSSGIAWQRGQAYTIQWDGFSSSHVKIQLYRGGTFVRRLAWATPNDKVFWWSVPSDIPSGTGYKIKITAQNKVVASDMSDRPFAIVNNPRVTYPTYAGVVWQTGSSYTIEWRQFQAANVKIELMLNGSVKRVLKGSTPNDGRFVWLVPHSTQVSNAYEIRVTAVGCSAQRDKSNNPFRIEKGTAVAKPSDPGITWNLGSVQQIRWQGFDAPKVKLELMSGWSVERVISSATPNDGLFTWKVPANVPPAANYKIRVTGTTGPWQQDVSDNNFTIASVPLVIYPSSAGITLTHGMPTFLRWQGFGSANVKIVLIKGGFVSSVIAYGTPNDGWFLWNVQPEGMPTGSDFKIRVVSQPGGTEADASDAQFTIVSAPVVMSPNSGVWLHGPTENITWSGFTGATVRIELWESWSFDRVLIATAPNTGTWSWSISGIPNSESYHVQVSSVSNPSEVDYSSGYFKISDEPKGP